jgi:hypothetical protein
MDGEGNEGRRFSVLRQRESLCFLGMAKNRAGTGSGRVFCLLLGSIELLAALPARQGLVLLKAQSLSKDSKPGTLSRCLYPVRPARP